MLEMWAMGKQLKKRFKHVEVKSHFMQRLYERYGTRQERNTILVKALTAAKSHKTGEQKLEVGNNVVVLKVSGNELKPRLVTVYRKY